MPFYIHNEYRDDKDACQPEQEKIVQLHSNESTTVSAVAFPHADDAIQLIFVWFQNGDFCISLLFTTALFVAFSI